MGEKIEVLLYGLGAIGSFYAYILQKSAQVRLSVVARSNYNAVKANGMTIKSQNHGEHIYRPAAVLKSPIEAGHKFDFIVCCNKATNPEETPKELAPVTENGKTVIALMQNGVGNEDPFHRAFPQSTILSGVVWIGGTQDSPGIVRQHASEDTEIGIFLPSGVTGPSAAQKDALSRFCGLLEHGKTPFKVCDNIQTQRWKKVIWNCAWNALTTLTASNTQEWLTSSDMAIPMTRRLMGEVIDVAQRAGVPGIERSLIDELLARINSMPGIYASMYHDSMNSRAMEVEVILGTPVRKARALGINTPTLDILYALIKAVDKRMERERNAKSTEEAFV